MSLLHDVSALLDDALVAYAGHPEAERLEAARRRLDEPLRVAIAGKVKAGKSTLLNALVGEVLAPTDAGECTRIVTWYEESHASVVTAEPRHGDPRQVPFKRDEGAIDVDLGEMTADDVERLRVEWPSSSLREMTLIDTPGIGSLSTEVSQRTHEFLTPDEEHETDADAVLYLMRHLHASDVHFLEAFHDEDVAQASPINAVTVLSRADEIGVGRLDAMEAAGRIARRYRIDPKVRRLCQTVVPMAGLLAQSACTLRQDEFKAFSALAGLPADAVEGLLLSADRFVADDAGIPLDTEVRQALIRRFGVFGIRLAVHLLREGSAASAPELAEALRARSGLDELRHVLETQFAGRRDLLKARAALTVLDAVLQDAPVDQSARLEAELERVEAGAHAFAELRLLNALRAGALELPESEAAERLLGADGSETAVRLGLDADAGQPALLARADAARQTWQKRAENPLSAKEIADASRVLVRTAEGMLAELAPATGAPA